MLRCETIELNELMSAYGSNDKMSEMRRVG